MQTIMNVVIGLWTGGLSVALYHHHKDDQRWDRISRIVDRIERKLDQLG